MTVEKLFNEDYLRHLCRTYALTPSKKYGQNFLIDGGVIEEIMAAAALGPGDTVVEVGPGFGTLTFALASQAKKVVSFEIEKKLQPYWEAQQKKYPQVEMVWGNVLKEFPALCATLGAYSVVANVPYQISSQLLRLFLEREYQPTHLVLMLQKEVVERICAKPGDMSLLALAVQLYAQPTLVAVVPKTAFWPSPAVDSAVVHITPHLAAPAAADAERIFTVARAGFASRRKLLHKNLQPLFKLRAAEPLVDVFARLGLSKNTRAQELSVAQWELLAKALN